LNLRVKGCHCHIASPNCGGGRFCFGKYRTLPSPKTKRPVHLFEHRHALHLFTAARILDVADYCPSLCCAVESNIVDDDVAPIRFDKYFHDTSRRLARSFASIALTLRPQGWAATSKPPFE
jgi:hypothetical protein